MAGTSEGYLKGHSPKAGWELTGQGRGPVPGGGRRQPMLAIVSKARLEGELELKSHRRGSGQGSPGEASGEVVEVGS